MNDAITTEPGETGPVDIELVGGPQDGGFVVQYTGRIAPVIWVGPRHMGDGHVSFSLTGPHDRKPVKYRFDGRVFRYDPK